ncbi:hypothetical protein [Streptomyces sp. NPDC058092]|uniref:hypothetical protein n=1 Tax=Streptomyces sp. NPDC058092 TaxID=3346336 RepID=UPI0036DFAF5F
MFSATIRSFSAEARARVHEEAPRVVRGIGEAHGMTVEAVVDEGYPVTVNDPRRGGVRSPDGGSTVRSRPLF